MSTKTVGFMAGLTATLRLHHKHFDFLTVVQDFVTVERYAEAFACPCRLCWKKISAFFFATAYLVLDFGVHQCGCLGVDVQSDSAR